MADLELASTCGRPDVAGYATRLSAEMRAGATTRQNPRRLDADQGRGADYSEGRGG